jgi:hypothetical protein
MATFEQFVILFQTTETGGHFAGRIYYPETLKDQDINVVLATYGQQGFEVIEQEAVQDGFRMAVMLKKSS